MRLDAGRCRDAFDGAIGGIFFGSENEKDFVILVVEFAERDQIALEARLHPAARAKDGRARGIETGIRLQTAAHVNEPLDTLPKQEEARGDLEDRQKLEEIFHAS